MKHTPLEEWMSSIDVVTLLHDDVNNFGSQRAAARSIGISEQYLSDVLTGRRMPGKKILDWLGIERKIVYLKQQALGGEEGA